MWFCFLLIVVVLINLISFYDIPGSIIFQYYIFQEVTGLMFLGSFSPSTRVLFLLLKVGVAPLHFWIHWISNYLPEFLLPWFLFWNKMIYLPVFPLILEGQIELLLWGLVVVYIQLWSVSSLHLLIILGSVESFSWVLLTLSMSLTTYWLVVLFYMRVFILLFNSSTSELLDLVLAIMFLGAPLYLLFMVKYLGIMGASALSLLPVLLIPLAMVSYAYLLFTVLLYTNISYRNRFLYIPLVLIALLLFIV